MNAREVVIFCESYPQIKNALYVATRPGEGPVKLVVTGNADLFRFLKLLNEKAFAGSNEVIFLEPYQGRTARAGSKALKALYYLPDILRERGHLDRIYRRYFACLKAAEVYFFSGCFNGSTFYLLKRMRQNNKLVYIPDPSYDVLTIAKSAPVGLLETAYLTKYRLVYGRGIELGLHPLGQKVTRMPDSFFQKNIKVMSRQERDSLLENLDLSRFKVFGTDGYSVMYFHEDLVEHGYIAEVKAFEEVVDRVFASLVKNFPEDKISLKYHPSSNEGREVKRLGQVLPHFIPAEFLYNKNIKLYLGYSSMALANVEKGMVISLIDLIPFKDDLTRDRLKEYLVKWSHTDILFPKSLVEFEKIVAGISGRSASIPLHEEVK